ncbi:MAG: hypothetical protein Q7W54_08020, partial [Bacteroidota bacterium]|nr:hypothetical protein [Bacteroidota bacterium]
PLPESNMLKKNALILSLRQAKFGTPSVDQEDINMFLNDPNKVIDESVIASNKAAGKFFIFPELAAISDFAYIKLAIKVDNLEMKSTISTNPINKTLDKGQWEAFWQMYNLIQETTVLI